MLDEDDSAAGASGVTATASVRCSIGISNVAMPPGAAAAAPTLSPPARSVGGISVVIAIGAMGATVEGAGLTTAAGATLAGAGLTTAGAPTGAAGLTVVTLVSPIAGGARPGLAPIDGAPTPPLTGPPPMVSVLGETEGAVDPAVDVPPVPPVAIVDRHLPADPIPFGAP